METQGIVAGKVALVTGGGSGIGRATAVLLAREGATVVVADRNAEAARATSEELDELSAAALAVEADVSAPDQVEAMVAAAVAEFGRLDIAVNNAGTSGGYRDVADLSEEAWDTTLGINLSGTFHCLKHEIAAMRANGGGAIVNMSSATVLKMAAPQPDYAASKSGIVALTRSTALAYGPDGIRVNAVLPGPTDTPMLSAGFNARSIDLTEMGKRYPLRRIATADDIANLVVWLVSDRAGIITGAAIPADGGYSLT